MNAAISQKFHLTGRMFHLNNQKLGITQSILVYLVCKLFISSSQLPLQFDNLKIMLCKSEFTKPP